MRAALGLAAFGSLACLFMTFSPAPTGPVAILFAPWSEKAENFAAIAAAGGRFVRSSDSGRVIVAESEDPLFRERIWHAPKVLFLIDPVASGLCTKDRQETP
jgi:hypothetical protein